MTVSPSARRDASSFSVGPVGFQMFWKIIPNKQALLRWWTKIRDHHEMLIPHRQGAYGQGNVTGLTGSAIRSPS